LGDCQPTKVSHFLNLFEKELLERSFTKRTAYFERKEKHHVNIFSFPAREDELGDGFVADDQKIGFSSKEGTPRTLVLDFNSITCAFEISDLGGIKGSVKEKRTETEAIVARADVIYRDIFSKSPTILRNYE